MRCFFSCCLLVLSAATASPGAEPARQNLNWAEKMFAELEHDFGVVMHGSDVRHRIAITNSYGEPITIDNVSTTCGCTAGEVSQKVLQPGESGYVEIKMNTLKFRQHKNSNVDVALSFANGRTRQQVRIPIHAYIRDDITTSDDVVDFGVIGAGESAVRRTSITYSGTNPWKITGIRDAGDGVQVEVGAPVRTPQGVRYDLKVSLASDLPLGHAERRLLVLTEEPNKSYLPLRVRVTVEPGIVVATPVIQLGSLQPGSTTTARIVVRGRQPFGIDAVEGIAGLGEVPPMNGAEKAVHVIPVTITAPQTAGRFSREVVLKLTGGHAPLTCEIEGDVLPAKGDLAARAK